MELSFKGKISELVKSSNIAEGMTEEDRRTIGLRCKTEFDQDKSTRVEWEATYAEAMKLALQITKEKTFPWPKCSNVNFPLITIAAINFHARSYPALIDGSGVVNYRVMGNDPDGSIGMRADRVMKHQNYLLLEKTPWEEEADKALLIVPIMGCAFKKTYPDYAKGCPQSNLILPQDLVVPYYTTDLKHCPRISQLFSLNKNGLESRKRKGIYLNVEYRQDFAQTPRTDPMDVAKNEGQKINPQGNQSDPWVPTDFVEQHTWLDLDQDGFAEPYIVTFIRDTGELCRIVARYSDTDVEYTRDKTKVVDIKAQHFFTKIPFIPSPDGGFYDIGFGSLLGNLNAAVNTAINQMFDAGTMEILGGGFVGRGVRIKRGDTTFAPYEWKVADSPGVALKDNIVPLPVRGPSEVLLQLLTFLISYTERISSANEVQMGELPGSQQKAGAMEIANANGLKIFAAIYKRIWRSYKEEFKKYYEATSYILASGPSYDDKLFGITPEDYRLPVSGICPSADPNISSPELAVKQAVAVVQLAREVGGQDTYKAVMRLYKAMKVPNPEEIFPDPKGPNAIPMAPDPKMLAEQTKRMVAEAKVFEIQKNVMLKVADLMRQVDESMANITKLYAEARKLEAEAKGVAVGHNIALIQSKIAAERQHMDEIFGIIEILQSGMGLETKGDKENESGDGKGKSEQGGGGKPNAGGNRVPGMAEPAANPEVLPLFEGASGGNEGEMGQA